MARQYGDVEISVFPSPERFRALDAQDESLIAAMIRTKVLPREKGLARV